MDRRVDDLGSRSSMMVGRFGDLSITFSLFRSRVRLSMGIHFACHVCSKKLNIKQELAGRRGICPACSARFRIPLHDTDKSAPVDTPLSSGDARPTNGHAGAGQRVADGGESVATIEANELGQSIELIEDDPSNTWYVRPPSGGQYGPATGEILRQWISEGRVAATSLLWREGWPQWREAKDALPELVGRLPDSPSDPTVSRRVSSREADEFGFGDSSISGAAEIAVSSNDNTPQPKGRADVGADRRTRSDHRTFMIVALAGLALCLLFALAYVLSR